MSLAYGDSNHATSVSNHQQPSAFHLFLCGRRGGLRCFWTGQQAPRNETGWLLRPCPATTLIGSLSRTGKVRGDAEWTLDSAHTHCSRWHSLPDVKLIWPANQRLVVDDFTPFYQSAEPTCNLPVVGPEQWHRHTGRIAHLCPRRMDLRPAVNLGACTSAHCMDWTRCIWWAITNIMRIACYWSCRWFAIPSMPTSFSFVGKAGSAFVRYDVTAWTSIDEWRWALYFWVRLLYVIRKATMICCHSERYIAVL